MIKLAEGNGNINIAPEHIVSVRNGDAGYSQINTVSEVYFVKESPEEVTRKILEYKMLMGKYNAYMQGAAVTEDAEIEAGNLMVIDMVKVSLRNLAGLEE